LKQRRQRQQLRSMEKTPEEEAFDKACGFLSYRQRSENEISRYLDKRGYSDHKDSVIERLTRVGLLDDQNFAETWVRERSSGRGYGSRRLRMELGRLGIDRELIDAALDKEYPTESETECAIRIAGQKAGKLGVTAPETRQKIYGFLIRRGFPGAIAKEAVENALRMSP
jgi:regulatory protein